MCLYSSCKNKKGALPVLSPTRRLRLPIAPSVDYGTFIYSVVLQFYLLTEWALAGLSPLWSPWTRVPTQPSTGNSAGLAATLLTKGDLHHNQQPPRLPSPSFALVWHAVLASTFSQGRNYFPNRKCFWCLVPSSLWGPTDSILLLLTLQTQDRNLGCPPPCNWRTGGCSALILAHS